MLMTNNNYFDHSGADLPSPPPRIWKKVTNTKMSHGGDSASVVNHSFRWMCPEKRVPFLVSRIDVSSLKAVSGHRYRISCLPSRVGVSPVSKADGRKQKQDQVTHRPSL